jgi:choline dehydrogenase
MQEVFDAFEDIGVPRSYALNSGIANGTDVSMWSHSDGQRSSAGQAYLDDAIRSANVTVLPESNVQKVLFDGTRAVGVEVLNHKSGEGRSARF